MKSNNKKKINLEEEKINNKMIANEKMKIDEHHNIFHSDCTPKVTRNRFPVLVFGRSDIAGHLHPIAILLLMPVNPSTMQHPLFLEKSVASSCVVYMLCLILSIRKFDLRKTIPAEFYQSVFDDKRFSHFSLKFEF